MEEELNKKNWDLGATFDSKFYMNSNMRKSSSFSSSVLLIRLLLLLVLILHILFLLSESVYSQYGGAFILFRFNADAQQYEVAEVRGNSMYRLLGMLIV